MLLLINKPKGWTSHDVVNKVRKITGEKRVGHAGTLDPNATGLLIIGVGRESTKKLGEITKNTTKEYVADIFLGEERDTDDIEGKIVKTHPKVEVSKQELQDVILEFLGEQEQVPPAFSAIKKNGKKSYQFARKGIEIHMEPRKIVVHELELISYKRQIMKVRFLVSSGTYIRSLARDIGRKLGTYGYLKDLKRTKVGRYSLKDAKTLEEIENPIKVLS